MAITCNFWSSKRELFLVGKSARVHGLSFERAVGTAAYFFSRESFNLIEPEAEAANDVVFPFNCREVSKTNK